MSVEQDVIDAIKARVDNRAYINAFAQPTERPTWPAARVTVASVTPDVDICGDGGEETAESRIQIDIVVSEAAGYTVLTALKDQVMSDMVGFDPPAVWDAKRISFDEETRTHRCSLDYLIYPSSSEDSP